MEDILWLILQLLFELFWNVLLEAFFEFGFEFLGHLLKPFLKISNPFLALLAYALFGFFAGAASILLIPHALIHHESLRILNIVITPIVTGMIMAGVGMLRKRKGQELIRLDTFGYAYVFALVMALVRFAWVR